MFLNDNLSFCHCWYYKDVQVYETGRHAEVSPIKRKTGQRRSISKEKTQQDLNSCFLLFGKFDCQQLWSVCVKLWGPWRSHQRQSDE